MAVHVAVDKKSDSSTASLSSSVHATRVMEQNVKKTENTVTSEGKDDGQILINCIKNCVFYQSSVGARKLDFWKYAKKNWSCPQKKKN